MWQRVKAYLSKGQIDEAINDLESVLLSCKSDRFKSLIGSEFINNKTKIADEINKFIIFCEKSFEVKAVYLEMNGYSINPDRWYFDLFAYDTYEKVEDDDLYWLAEWKSEDWPEITLKGMEKAQQDFDWYVYMDGHKDDLAKEASEYAELLVECKFAKLIEQTISTGTIQKKIPILAAAHDTNYISIFMT